MSDNDEPEDYLETMLEARTQHGNQQARDEQRLPPPERALRPYHVHGHNTSHRLLSFPIPSEPGLTMANRESVMLQNPRQQIRALMVPCHSCPCLHNRPPPSTVRAV